MDMTENSHIRNALEAAEVGPMFEGDFLPTNGHGKLRISYNWLYSALNCDPRDNSSFPWVVSKVNTSAVSLSPKNGYGGMHLYASVRPDWSYFVQVQAPRSADWITEASGDEELTLTELGFLTINFKGLNGKYIALNGSETPHDGHSGYKLQSNATAAGKNTNFFVSVSQILQSKLSIPQFTGQSPEEVERILSEHGLPNAEKIAKQITG